MPRLVRCMREHTVVAHGGRERIGGYTGDCLGFAQQIFELAIYLVGLAWISF